MKTMSEYSRLLLLVLMLPWEIVHAQAAIFVSIAPQKQLVEAIAGKAVDVRVLLGPGESPETYEPTASQLVALADAKLFFRIGVPFERIWIDRIAANNPELDIVDVRQGISLRDIDAVSGHGHGGHKDPHIWTSPALLVRQGRTVRDALIRIDPPGRRQYEDNFRRYQERLKSLDDDIQRILAQRGSDDFLVYHPSWGYFADDYGLNQIPVEVEGRSPQARGLAELMDRVHKLNLRILIVAAQTSSRQVAPVADMLGVDVVFVDPLAEDNFRHLRHLATLIAGK